jgi:hypothetical protein
MLTASVSMAPNNLRATFVIRQSMNGQVNYYTQFTPSALMLVDWRIKASRYSSWGCLTTRLAGGDLEQRCDSGLPDRLHLPPDELQLHLNGDVALGLEIKKTLLCVGGLMLAAGGPVTVYTTSDVAGGVKRWFAKPATTVQQPASATNAPAPALEMAVPSGPLRNPAITAMPTPGLAEVSQFDISVEWIMQRWPRVSTGLPYLQLQGYRVPLVTGTSLTDVAGSLTYYFNAHQRVDRIAFRGTTGDPTVLVSLLTAQHHFTRRLTNDPGLVLYEAVDSNNHPAGELKIRSARVVKVEQPYGRFELDLVMDRTE